MERLTHLFLQQSDPALPLMRHTSGYFSHVSTTLSERNRLIFPFGFSLPGDIADTKTAKAISMARRKRVFILFLLTNKKKLHIECIYVMIDTRYKKMVDVFIDE